MSTYKLYYFNGRGRAEVSRLIFAAVGQKFEDIRIERSEWPSRRLQMPTGTMPVLEVDGVKLPQSASIARFLAKQFYLAGRDNFEQAKVDAVADTISDAVSGFIALNGIQDPARKQETIRRLVSEDLPEHLQNLENLGRIYGNGGPFFVGRYLTWADLYFYDACDTFQQFDRNILNRYPFLKSNRQEIEQHPNISAYVQSRPNTPF